MFVRGRYGHGGRLGMEKEWRGDPAVSGGGEMLDQGVHLIDLARWFLGDFTDVSGHVATYFWDWPVEDNGFALLRTAAGQVAWLHASCTEWKNLFSFEIYGRDGKLAHRRPRRQLRRRAPRLLPDAPPDGPAAKRPSGNTPARTRSWQAEWRALRRVRPDPPGARREHSRTR